ncbi:hypothetical protein HK098_003017 [Nowakowskiella sp. JEL0407]|nr:hypothetical protein HK098_003017 [Nowakowskiella sp. JEL0407]
MDAIVETYESGCEDEYELVSVYSDSYADPKPPLKLQELDSITKVAQSEEASTQTTRKQDHFIERRLQGVEYAIEVLESGMQRFEMTIADMNAHVEIKEKVEHLTKQIDSILFGKSSDSELKEQVAELETCVEDHKRDEEILKHVVAKVLPHHEGRISMIENNVSTMLEAANHIESQSSLVIAKRLEELNERTLKLENTMSQLVYALDVIANKFDKIDGEFAKYALVAGFARRDRSCGLDFKKEF